MEDRDSGKVIEGIFFFRRPVQTDSGAHPAPNRMGIGGFLPRGKVARA